MRNNPSWKHRFTGWNQQKTTKSQDGIWPWELGAWSPQKKGFQSCALLTKSTKRGQLWSKVYKVTGRRPKTTFHLLFYDLASLLQFLFPRLQANYILDLAQWFLSTMLSPKQLLSELCWLCLVCCRQHATTADSNKAQGAATPDRTEHWVLFSVKLNDNCKDLWSSVNPQPGLVQRTEV